MKEIKKVVRRSDKKRCPKCGSNKWKCIGDADKDSFQMYEKMYERGSMIFEYKAFAKYKCEKCGWGFIVEGRNDRFFCAAEKGECFRCGSKNWERLTILPKGSRCTFFRCKHCNAEFVVDKSV